MPRDFAFPGTSDQYAPSRVCEVEHYRLELDLDLADKSIKGSCMLRLAAIARARTSIELDAVDLDVLRITCDGMDLAFQNDGRRLRIDFDEPLELGECKEVVIDYQATPTRGLYFTGPDEGYPDKPTQVWSQGQDIDSRHWFPCFDSPHQKSTSEVIVHVPETWFALSNGVLIRDQIKGGRRTLHWSLDVPHSCYLITLAAGEFAEIRDHWNEVEVNYYSHPDRIEDCRRTLHRTPEMIELFSKLFGVRYPYNKYAQVFIADFTFGGMENTTATSLADSLMVDERAAIDFNMESLVAHELAHQWFGDLLTCRDWGEGWLHEGFATYSEYLWREHAEGVDAAGVELAAFGGAYLAEDGTRYRRSIVTKRYQQPLDIFDRHLYDKAGRVVHMLRRVLGDEDFFASLAFYLEKHRHGIVETRDLARAIEACCGRNLDWFFDQWVLQGSGHPKLKIDMRWDHEHSVFCLEVAQTHSIDAHTPLFRLPTELLLVIGGKTVCHPVEVSQASQLFTFACKREPEQAIFDPGKHLLCEMVTSKTPAMWRAELRAAEAASDRIDAARHCATLAGKAMFDALVEVLNSDDFWALRQACAESLGTMRQSAARDVLMDALFQQSDARVRKGAAKGLASFVGDQLAAEALREKLRSGDESYFVEAECCASLGAIRARDSLALLQEAATRPSFTEVIQQKAYQAIGELRDLDNCEYLLAAMAYGQPSFARRAAMRALVSLCVEHEGGEVRTVRETLIEALHDRDFRVRLQAVASLEALGQKQACSSLQAIADDDADGRMRRRAKEALRSLQDGQSANAQIAELRDATESLRKQVFEVRSKLDVMETGLAGGLRAAGAAKQPSEAAAMHGPAPTPQRRKGGKKTIPF